MYQIIDEKEFSDWENPTIEYKLNDSVLRCNVVVVVKMFENENVKFSECMIRTYDEDGYTLTSFVHDIEHLESLDTWPSSYMAFIIDFVDINSGVYSYTIKTSTNDNKVYRYIDKRKVQ